jgi:large subunit ribosomal protein L24
MKLRVGDNVKIIAGKNRLKTGKVLKTFPKEARIMVEGVNMYKKHVRPKREGDKGEVVDITRPFNISNANLICPHCNKPTRIGHAMEKEEKKRICKKCKATI